MTKNKLYNLIIYSIATFFSLILFYLIFKVSKVHSFSYMIPYYTLSISLIIGSLLLLRFSLKLKENALITAFSFFIGVYVIELILINRKPVDRFESNFLRATAQEVPFDTRALNQVIDDLRKNNIEAYPAFTAHKLFGQSYNNELLPLAGVANKKIVLCNESGKYSTYKSDEYGFNNPLGTWENLEGDMVLIGDSFVHGSCVDNGHTIADHLRKNNLKIFNLGAGGSGPLLQLAMFNEYATKIKTKKLLWFFYEFDISIDLNDEMMRSRLLPYLHQENYNQNLFNRQSEIDSVLMNFYNRKMNLGNNNTNNFGKNDLLKFAKLSQLRYLINKRFSTNKNIYVFEEIIKKVKEKTKENGTELVFIFLPAWHRYGTKVDQGKFENRDKILSILNNLDIKIIDIHQELVMHDDPLSLFPFRQHNHYTSEGYYLISEAIMKQLEN